MNKVSSSTKTAGCLPIIVLSLLFVAMARLDGASSFIEAVHRGDAARVRSLLADRPDLNARDADGNTALHWAALNGDARLVKELLERGAPPSITNHGGATPLLYAVGNVASVVALLEAGAGDTVNRASKFGTTPLVAAARYPVSSNVVRLLLEQGADAQSRTNGLREAASAGDVASFKMLL